LVKKKNMTIGSTLPASHWRISEVMMGNHVLCYL